MAPIRSARVAEQMKKELAELLRTELRDPRIGFATVTRVEVTGDLQHARAYVSVFGDSDAKSVTMQALTRTVGYLRGEISRRLRMRVAPEISFRLDESGEYSAHIDSLLRKLHKDGDGAPAGARQMEGETEFGLATDAEKRNRSMGRNRGTEAQR